MCTDEKQKISNVVNHSGRSENLNNRRMKETSEHLKSQTPMSLIVIPAAASVVLPAKCFAFFLKSRTGDIMQHGLRVELTL